MGNTMMRIFDRESRYAPLTPGVRERLFRALWSGATLAALATGCGEETRSGDRTRDGGQSSDVRGPRDGGTRDGGETRDGETLPPRARAWETPEIVAETRAGYYAHALADARENVVLVWDDLDGEVLSKVYDRERATWSAPVRLDPENPDDSIAAATAPGGGAGIAEAVIRQVRGGSPLLFGLWPLKARPVPARGTTASKKKTRTPDSKKKLGPEPQSA